MSAVPSEPSKQRVRLQPDVRRQRILDTALYEFAANGYAASMGQIADAAGVTRPGLYHYFPAKVDLFAAVAERAVTDLMRYIVPAAATEGSDRVRLRALFAAVLRCGDERPQTLLMLFRTLEEADREIVAVHASVRDALLGSVTMLLPEETTALDIAPGTTRGQVIAEMLLGTLTALVRWRHQEPEVPREDVLDVLIEVAWKGVGGVSTSVRRQQARERRGLTG